MQNQNQIQSNQNNEQDPMIDEGYQRKYGGYKPHFKGIAPGYFPFENIDYVYVILFTILTWAFQVPIWYGLWRAGEANSKQYAIVACCVFIGFFVLMTVGIYFGGRLRRVVEKKMIQDKLKALEEAQEQKKIQDQKQEQIVKIHQH